MLSTCSGPSDSWVRRLVRECLTDREREIVTLRYGPGRCCAPSARSQKTRHQEAVSRIESGRWKARRSHRRARPDLFVIPRRSGYNTTGLPVGRTVPTYYIGIDLGGTNIKGALVSKTGEITGR